MPNILVAHEASDLFISLNCRPGLRQDQKPKRHEPCCSSSIAPQRLNPRPQPRKVPLALAKPSSPSSGPSHNTSLAHVNPTSLNFSSIESLNGGKYKKWRQDMEIILGLMEYNLAFRYDELVPLTENNTVEQRSIIGEAMKKGIPTSDKAEDFLEGMEAKFKVSKKEKMGNLITALTTLKFNESRIVRENMLKMAEAVTKLRDLEMPIDDTFVIHMALNPLSLRVMSIEDILQCQEKWGLNDLLSICVQVS
ncbi:hypothetical protein ACFX13_033035 [Malus domestica]